MMENRPWYIAASLSILAWIAGLLTTAAIGVAAREILGLDDGLTFSILGGVVTVLGLVATRQIKAVFLQEACTAVILGGAFAIVFGIHAEFGMDMAALTSLAVAAVLYPLVNANTLRFVLVSMALILTGLALENHLQTYAFDVIALVSLPLGAAFTLLPPPKVDARPLSLALLLATPVLSGISFGTRAVTQGGGVLTVMGLALLLGVLILMRRHIRLSVLIALSLSAAVAAWALPAGGTAALLILALGWAKGDRALAIIGAIVTGYFLTRYYGEVDLSLLHKSFMLCAVGLALLATWALTTRGGRVR